MVNFITGIKKILLKDNLTKTLIIIVLLAIFMIYKNKFRRESFNNIGMYNSLTNNNFFNNEKYIDLYENVILDNNKNEYYMKSISEKTDINTNGIIINVGCKTGSLNKLLHTNKINSIGIDRSNKVINYCRDKYPNINFDNFNLNNFENIGINYDQPITHILCLDMEIYYIDNIELFFKQAFNLLDNNGYLVLHLVDHKKYNNTSVYSRINNLNPNNLSIKKVNDSVIKFNDIIYNTKFRIFPNDFGNDTIWFTETITNIDNNSVYENIHKINNLSTNDIKKIATQNQFKLINIININLHNYNNEYLYIFKKNKF